MPIKEKVDEVYKIICTMNVSGDNQDLAVMAKNYLKEIYNELKAQEVEVEVKEC